MQFKAALVSAALVAFACAPAALAQSSSTSDPPADQGGGDKCGLELHGQTSSARQGHLAP